MTLDSSVSRVSYLGWLLAVEKHRRNREVLFMPPQRWTNDEILVLEKSVEEGLSPESMARKLNRSDSSVRAKIKALQSKNRNNPWTKQDVETLKALANEQCSIEVISLRIGRSPQAVKAKLEYESVVENARLELSVEEKEDYRRLQSLEKSYQTRGFLRSILAFVTQSDEDLTKLNLYKLRGLANEGADMAVIAAKMGASEASVRGRLVHSGVYNQYLIQNHSAMISKLSKLEKKLGIDKSGEDEEIDVSGVLGLIERGEGLHTEFKSTYRYNTKANLLDCPLVKNEVVKVVSGFMNARGGTLLIGVKDSGLPTGIFDDDLNTPDDYIRHLLAFMQHCLGKVVTTLVNIVIVKMPSGEEVCVVETKRSDKPIWCRNPDFNTKKGYPKEHEIFYVRHPATTEQLSGSEAQAYCRKRFPDV